MKSTPSNVTCQKCLKKGHYSYECKAAPQERPYQARPSRTQQLLNPKKFAPKLASDTTDTLQRKKGVADEQLAKKEAERAKQQRNLSDGEDDEHEGPERKLSRAGSPRRREASVSSDSVSSISTRSSRSPHRSQGGRSGRRSPSVNSRASPKHSRSSRSRSFDSRSRSPGETRSRSASRGSSRVSRDRIPAPRVESRRDDRGNFRGGERPRRYRRSPSEYSDDERPSTKRRRASPGPSRSSGGRGRDDDDRRRYRDRDDGPRGGGYRDRDEGQRDRPAPPPREEPRERSLSPFSKRLAMTRSMNAR